MTRLDAAKEQLDWADFLDVSDFREPPAGEAAVRAVETKLGVRLPEPLRSFWADAAALYGYHVKLTDAGRDKLEVDPAATQFEIVRVGELTRRTRGGRDVVRFTNDGFGNGWAIDVSAEPNAAGNVVWVQYDGPDDEALSNRAPSLDALFDALEQSYFVEGEIGEILEEWLPRPTRRRPTTETRLSARPAAKPAPPSEPEPARPKARSAAPPKQTLRAPLAPPPKRPALAPRKASTKPALEAATKPKPKARPKSKAKAKKATPKKVKKATPKKVKKATRKKAKATRKKVAKATRKKVAKATRKKVAKATRKKAVRRKKA